MSYILDINRELIKKALLCLGIESEELRRRNLESFQERGISEDIKHLRYNFFLRKQQELVRQIKAHIKEEILRSIAKKQESDKNISDILEEFDSIDTQENKLEKVKQRYQVIINRYFTNTKECLLGNQELEYKLIQGKKIRETIKTSMSRQRMKMQELRIKQKENYENKAKFKLDNSVCISRDSQSQPPSKSINRKMAGISPLSISKIDSYSELEISAKLKQYEEKMDKSKILYDNFMKNKKDAISRALERSVKSMKITEIEKNEEFNKKLSKIIEKSQSVEKRRDLFLKTQTENRIRQQIIKDGRRVKAKETFNEKERLQQLKIQELERKMEKSHNLLEEKNDKWCKELELRNELQRLKEDEILLNAERKKRIA